MEVRVLALTNNHYIISQVDEVATEDIGQPDCKLTNPVILKTTEEKITVEEGQVLMTPWLQSFTRVKEFMISSDKILTIADPTADILEKYEDLIKGK